MALQTRTSAMCLSSFMLPTGEIKAGMGTARSFRRVVMVTLVGQMGNGIDDDGGSFILKTACPGEISKKNYKLNEGNRPEGLREAIDNQPAGFNGAAFFALP
jgi:hypothetical protein